ncbi:MAG: hypothetical protein J4432_00275 [DPANN group archaeon]|nr:hypothetical protein [DPANN group archaeon]
MDLYDYFNFMDLNNDDNIMVVGNNSMIIAAYLYGKSREINKRLFVKAVVPPESSIANLIVARSEAEKYPEKSTIFEGFSRISVTTSDFLSLENGQFNKIILTTDVSNWLTLIDKVNEVFTGDIILFELPFSYAMPLKTERRFLWQKTHDYYSFKQVLENSGVKVTYYDVHEDKLRIACVGDFDKVFREAQFLTLGEAAKRVYEEIKNEIMFAKDGSGMAIKSQDGEYLYVCEVKDTQNRQLTMNFVFLDGSITTRADGKVLQQSKEIKVAIVPYTQTFEREVLDRTLLIIEKKMIPSLFAEPKK